MKCPDISRCNASGCRGCADGPARAWTPELIDYLRSRPVPTVDVAEEDHEPFELRPERRIATVLGVRMRLDTPKPGPRW